MVGSTWMMQDQTSTMAFSPKSSVFNTLIHFGSKVLKMSDGLPVVKYKSLLRWNDVAAYLGEDILTTSFLASYDIYRGIERKDFCWQYFIDHDNFEINGFLHSELSELHSHLKGSAYVFPVNWLCMVNHVMQAIKNIKGIESRKSPLLSVDTESAGSSLKLDVLKAAAIRFLLVAALKGIDETALLQEIVLAERFKDAECHIDELQRKIASLSNLVAYHYNNIGKVDYAIDGKSVTKSLEDNDFFMTIFSGERNLLYQYFRIAYGGVEDAATELRLQMFYVYLLLKSNIRQELLQLNNVAGFSNFADYDDRKSLFCKGIEGYNDLLPFTSIMSYFYQPSLKRYLETRICPKNKAKDIHKDIVKYCNIPSLLKDKNEDDKGIGWQYYFILHFIKKADSSNSVAQTMRHSTLREEIYEQALAIAEFRESQSEVVEKIVGIDAANSELLCRPEVMAQAFRFLRDHHVTANAYGNNISDLRVTYHVGEDYYDVVDGLRAVDEVLHFLNFGNGDRLGHALVLGENVKRYYESRNNTVVMPKQTLLDNAVWLYVRSHSLSVNHSKERFELKRLFENLFEEIYKEIQMPTINEYYQSWLLRGDDPQCYSTGEFNPNPSIETWNSYSVNNDLEANTARQNETATMLMMHYHFDNDAKRRGNEVVEWKVSESMISLIDDVRESLLCKVENMDICIECNPTSNFRIGGLLKYEEHPIVRFNNYGLNTPYPNHSLPVTIHTDDKGVFSTSLEREYSLIAAALGKSKLGENSNQQIYDWIERVRVTGNKHRFKK